MPSTPGTPPSVHDSNAGHDFHVLWATRRVIELLSPSSTLRAVKMEGVSAEDVATLSPGQEHFLAADLTEYHDGEHFADAASIVISQLKYSTRHPTEPWSGSRLRIRKGSNNSVIERLAASYQDMLTAGQTRDDIQQKARICLVSNQPLRDDLADLWRDAQTHLSALGLGQVTLAQLLTVLPAQHHKEIQKLHTCICVADTQFTDFLRVLDLSGCGADSRMAQQLAVLHDLAPTVPTGEHNVFLRLTDLVRRQALPENQHAAPLTRLDVLAELKVFSEKDLFPEPAAFNYPAQPVPTAEAQDLADCLIEGSALQLLAHGAAGVGKSTTVQQIAPLLPAGSVVLLYDCYADGTYYSLRTERHTLGSAVLQLSNELAVATGLPFLITPPSRKAQILDYFEQRLSAAAQIVEAKGGLLVLVIDAADNSVLKANQDPHSLCFVQHFWELVLPSNCRLLMTARTHRKASLQAPGSTKEIALTGFDAAASAVRLRHVFPKANDRSAAVFHHRTGGNPRVQEYWLDAGTHPIGSDAAFLHSFRRKAYTATEIIEDIVKAAVVEVPNPEQAQEQLATLVCLQRPIPLSTFAQACGISLDQATTFCQALKPGLLLEGDLIGFRDEDFETQLRVRSATAERVPAAHQRLGTFFLPLAATDTYAAQAVAEHFAAAHRFADLIGLVLNGPSAAFILDSALRLRTERRRLQLALQAAAVLRDDAAGAKVAVLAAESLRANEAVRSLVQADVALATQFGEAEAVIDFFSPDSDARWWGGVYFTLAAHYARQDSQRTLAERYLAYAHAWVRRIMRLPKHERHHEGVKAEDITSEAETYYWLHGADEAYTQLKRWRPARVRLHALHILIGRLAALVPAPDLEAQLRSLELPLLAQCVAIAALWENDHVVQLEWIQKVQIRLLPLLQRHRFKPVLNDWPLLDEVDGFYLWPLRLAELFTHLRLPVETSLLLLDLLPPFPSMSVSRHGDYSDRLVAIQIACLKASLKNEPLTGEILFPRPPKPEKERYSESSYEDNEYREHLNHFILLYTGRVRLLQGALSAEEATGLLETGFTKLYPNRQSTEFFTRQRQNQWLRSAIALAVRVPSAEALLESLADRFQPLVGRYLARQLWLSLARQTLAHSSYQAVALRCLERAATDAEADDLPVADRWQLLLTCAQISYHYATELSRDFYRRALEAAHQGVGNDVAYRLHLGADVVKRLSTDPSDAHSTAALLAGLVEAYRLYVSDDDVDMPFDETIFAVTHLHPVAGAALALRWDLSNVRHLDDSVIPLADSAAADSYWHPSLAIWLLKLCGDKANVSYGMLQVLDHLPLITAAQRLRAVHVLSAVAKWVATDTPLRYRKEALEKVVNWASKNKLDQAPAIQDIQGTLMFVSLLSPTRPRERPTELADYEIKRQAQVLEWDAAAQRGDLAAFEKWRVDLPYISNEILPAIERLAQKVGPDQRTEVLDLLKKLRMSYDYNQPALDVLARLLAEWQAYKPVRDWAATNLPRYYGLHIHLITGERDIPNHLERFCGLALADSSRAALLLPGIAEQLDSLNSEILCRVATALTQRCSAVQLADFIRWLLPRMKQQLEDDQKALPFTVLLPSSVPANLAPPAAFAQFVWTTCGHPDKRVRWRIIHAARQVLTDSHNQHFAVECLTELVRLSRTTTGLLPDLEEFYWQSARVWLLILLDRVADEVPTALLTHVSIISEHAFDSEFPHAQIRELARRVLLRVEATNPGALSPTLIERLLMCNRPKSCLVERGHYGRVKQADKAFPAIKAQGRFKFDELDTVGYWFRPLGEVFGQSEKRITALAEYWVVEKWGRSKVECVADRFHDQSRYDWGLMRHYKNDDTKVDNLQMHLTHHALMCAAGQLVDNYSECVDTYDEPPSKWKDWLENYLTRETGHSWLTDWRGPAPLLAECWGEFTKPWKRRRLVDYRAALGQNEPNRAGWIVVFGSHSFGGEELSGDVYVSSVLVRPDSARSLMWALHPVKRNDYSFPTFGLDDSDPELPDEVLPFFELLPLLEEEPDSSEKGIERHDTAARNVHSAYPKLSQHFIAQCGLVTEQDGKRYVDASGELVAEWEIWDDDLRDVNRAYKHEAQSSGHRLWVRQAVLREYLSSTNYQLVIQATLSRNIETKNDDKRINRYDIGKRRIALFHPDGSLETVAGHCSLGPPHS